MQFANAGHAFVLEREYSGEWKVIESCFACWRTQLNSQRSKKIQKLCAKVTDGLHFEYAIGDIFYDSEIRCPSLLSSVRSFGRRPCGHVAAPRKKSSFLAIDSGFWKCPPLLAASYQILQINSRFLFLFLIFMMLMYEKHKSSFLQDILCRNMKNLYCIFF